MEHVIVIGGGISGCLTALRLAETFKVTIIESGEEIIPLHSSSYNQCYKLHTGMHYLHSIETAKRCLESSVEFAKRYRDCLASPNSLQKPWRRGRHFVMQRSDVPQEKVKDFVCKKCDRTL